MVMAAMAAISALSSIMGGFSANRAYNTEANWTERQAGQALFEGQQSAQLKAEEVRSFQADQAVGYLSSGVTLEGSPALVLEQTRRRGQMEVDSIIRAANSRYGVMMAQAGQYRRAGRNALIGGFGNAASNAATTYIKGKGIGLFGGTPTTSATFNGPAPVPSQPMPGY